MILLYDKEKLEIEILLVVRCSLQTFLHELRKMKKSANEHLPTNNFQQILDKLLFFLYDLFYKIGVRHFLQFLQQNPRRK